MSMHMFDSERMAAGDTGRRLIDTNKGITNVANYDQLKHELINTLQHIVSLLEPHCGPRSKYAMIVTGLGNADFEPNIFTKDGIKTLSYIEYASCIQAYVKELLTYIGKRVDNVAKDGTTTSMLFAAKFILKCLNDEKYKFADMTTFQKEQAFKRINEGLFKVIDEHAWTIESLAKEHPDLSINEIGGHIAYMQAMSSSGGNEELSSVLRDVFRASPSEVWEHLQMSQSVLEKNTSFEVRYQAADYRLLSLLTSKDLLNTDLNTRYVDHNVRVFVYPDQIEYGVTVLDRVVDLLENFPDEQPLAIVAKSICPILIKQATNKNMTRKHPISLHVVQDDNKFSRSDWELMAVLAMSGTPSMTDLEEVPEITDVHLFEVERLEVNGSYLEFFGMGIRGCTVTEEEKLHPYYKNKDLFQPYTDLSNALIHVIDRAKNGHEKNQYLVMKASAILLQMTSLHAPAILIGGSTHENLSNLAVVQDALGATMESLNGGFFAGGMLTMLWGIYNHQTTVHMASNQEKTLESIFVTQFVCAMGEVLSDLVDLVYEAPMTQGMFDEYDSEWKSSSYINALMVNKDYTPTIQDLHTFMKEGGADYPVIQPVAIYKELFSRIGELVVRLLSTDKIIVPGGAFVEDKE